MEPLYANPIGGYSHLTAQESQERNDKRELQYLFRDVVTQRLHQGFSADEAMADAIKIVEAYRTL